MHASFQSHVTRANPTATMELFIHSWNPSLHAVLQRVWKPAWIACEPQIMKLDKLRSFARSLRRWAALVQEWSHLLRSDGHLTARRMAHRACGHRGLSGLLPQIPQIQLAFLTTDPTHPTDPASLMSQGPHRKGCLRDAEWDPV